MRVVACLSAALLIPASAAQPEGTAPEPFTASWERCDTYRDASICAWIAMVQNQVHQGALVCAIRQDFATNAYYTHRLIGTADGNQVRFDRICGDTGSETGTFCAGQAPEGAEKVGWSSYDQTLHLCEGGLSYSPAGCTGAKNGQDMARVSTSPLPLSHDDRDWLVACANGR